MSLREGAPPSCRDHHAEVNHPLLFCAAEVIVVFACIVRFLDETQRWRKKKRMNPVRVEVNDKMQKGYVYLRTKPIGRAFRPGFTPDLTPRQMLELGVFGGKYMTDCRDEFPASWFPRAKLSADRARASLNYFGVNASQPLSEWRRKGWIHPDDPRGWFQWYCRYYSGRRHEDDLRQIARWRAVRRHVAQLKKHCKHRDLTCRRRQRQALLHWAYDSRKI